MLSGGEEDGDGTATARRRDVVFVALGVAFVVLVTSLIGVGVWYANGHTAQSPDPELGVGIPHKFPSLPESSTSTIEEASTVDTNARPRSTARGHPPSGATAYQGEGTGAVISGDIVASPSRQGLDGYSRTDPSQVVWTVPCKSGIGWYEPAPRDHAGRVLFLCDWMMEVVETKTGKVLWTFNLPTSATGTWSRALSTVIALEWDSELHVFDAATGSPLWSRRTEGNAPIGIDEGLVYLAFSDHLEALDARTGQHRWDATETSMWIVSTDQSVFVRSPDLRVVAIDKTNGEIRWRTEPDENRLWDSTLLGASADTVVAFGNYYRNLVGYDAHTGAFKWEYNSEMSEILAATMAGNRIALTRLPSNLFVLDANSGAALMQRTNAFKAIPSLGSGMVATVDIGKAKLDVDPVP